MKKTTKKTSGYSKKKAVKDLQNPNRAGKTKPLIDHHGKNVRGGK